MFKGGNGKDVATNSADRLNRLVEGTHVTGDIKADSNFRIDGFLSGSLNTLGKLVVGPNGKIEGDVKCANADIEGEVEGNLIVEGLLNIKATAKITGTVTTNQIGMEVGCTFNGTCNYTLPNAAPSKTVPLLEEAKTITKEDSQIVY